MVIHLTFQDDPGFRVPLKAMDQFPSFNRLLPSEYREATSWKSLTLTMADGSEQVIEAPKKRFGKADYDLRSARPGMGLFVLDPETGATREMFGPLSRIHVDATEPATATPPPLAIVASGKALSLDVETLKTVPSVSHPQKSREAWLLPAVLEKVAPDCKASGLAANNGKDTLDVAAADIAVAYLRYNRKGSWMFSTVPEEGEGKRLRDITGIDVRCGE